MNIWLLVARFCSKILKHYKFYLVEVISTKNFKTFPLSPQLREMSKKLQFLKPESLYNFYFFDLKLKQLLKKMYIFDIETNFFKNILSS